MKILTGSNYFPEHAGGIEIVAKNLVDRWRERHQVRWMACEVADSPNHSRPGRISLPASNFTEEKLGFPFPLPMPWTIKRMFEEVRSCDIVHFHDCLYAANLLTFIASKLYQKPVVVTQHIGPIRYRESYKNILQKIAYATYGRWILENADQVIFISKRVKEYFAGKLKFPQPPIFIPNGVDRKIFHPPTELERRTFRSQFNPSKDKPILIFVGRFIQKKGLHLIKEFAKARNDWHWWIVGSGDLDPNKWEMENIKVFPHQPQQDLRRFYSTADLFVLPSVGEGFPLSALEALACGLPVALSMETASNLPHAPFIKLDISDTPSMINKIEEVLNNKEKLSELRKISEMYAFRWDWEEITRQYECIFSTVLSDSGK